MRPPSAPTTARRCPRCGASFGCGAGSGDCWCRAAPLSAELRDELATAYTGCLCADCLRALAPGP